VILKKKRFQLRLGVKWLRQISHCQEIRGFELRQTYDMTVSNLIRKPNTLTKKLKCYQFREHQGCLRFADGGVVGDREDGGVFDRNVVHRATKFGQANQERVLQLSRYRNVQSLRIEKLFLTPKNILTFFLLE
jgi:hypothetical protein